MATDTMSYEVAKNIVEHGSVAMSYNIHDMEAHRGIDGRYYSPYGIGHPIYGIPFYLVGRTVEQWSGFSTAKPEIFRKAAFVLGSAVAAALTVWIAFWFALRLGGDVKGATYSALTLGFSTLLWPYAKFGFNAPLATLFVLAGTYATWVGARSGRSRMEWLGGVGLAGALFVKHELVLVAVPLAVWIAFESRDRRLAFTRLLRVGLPLAIALVVTLIYNDVRFGNPLDTGYLRDQTVISGSIWIGIPGLLVSPGRSLFLYSPIALVGLGALAGLWRSDRATASLFVGTLGILLLFYGSLGFWDADRSYGPRYLVPALPYLCIPLALWFRRSAQDGVRRTVVAAAVAQCRYPGSRCAARLFKVRLHGGRWPAYVGAAAMGVAILGTGTKRERSARSAPCELALPERCGAASASPPGRCALARFFRSVCLQPGFLVGLPRISAGAAGLGGTGAWGPSLRYCGAVSCAAAAKCSGSKPKAVDARAARGCACLIASGTRSGSVMARASAAPAATARGIDLEEPAWPSSGTGQDRGSRA